MMGPRDAFAPANGVNMGRCTASQTATFTGGRVSRRVLGGVFNVSIVALLFSCAPAKNPSAAKGCTELTTGFLFRPPSAMAQLDPAASLTPPRSLRIDRVVAGKAAFHCDSELAACDGEDARSETSAASIEAAFANPDVQLALSQGERFGNVSAESNDNFVVTRGRARLEVGGPCPTPPGTCKAIPPAIDHLVTLLTALYAERHPSCTGE
ncbi:MAG: hypothetical protein NVSMB1_22320 [Polyangiales bacterium]